jgi:hypothetical protein
MAASLRSTPILLTAGQYRNGRVRATFFEYARNVGIWHKAAIDSVVWKVRKGSIQSFAAPATNGSKADKPAVQDSYANVCL